MKHEVEHFYIGQINVVLPIKIYLRCKYKKKALTDGSSIKLHKGRKNDFCAQGFFLMLFSRIVVERGKTPLYSA